LAALALCIVVVLASAFLWVHSRYRWSYILLTPHPRYSLALSVNNGTAIAILSVGATRPNGYRFIEGAFGMRRAMGADRWDWRLVAPHELSRTGSLARAWETCVPLPILTALALVPVTVAAARALIHRRRPGPGCCPKCRYNLSGLLPGSPCPECAALANTL
jgi:hypothetical protein